MAPLIEAFGEELASTLGGMLGAPALVGPGERVVSGDAWRIVIVTDDKTRGSWTLLVDGLGAQAVTASIMGLESVVPAPAIADTWREAVGQALSGLSQREVASGAVFRLASVDADAMAKPSEPHTSLELSCTALTGPLAFTVCGEIDVTVATEPARPASARPESAVVSPLGAKGQTEPMSAPPDRLNAILDIELPLVVRFGRTELPLKALAHLGPGSLIDLGRSADDPVDLLVSDRVVARGEVVVVGGSYGVRILDVVSPRERARSMEA